MRVTHPKATLKSKGKSSSFVIFIMTDSSCRVITLGLMLALVLAFMQALQHLRLLGPLAWIVLLFLWCISFFLLLECRDLNGRDSTAFLTFI